MQEVLDAPIRIYADGVYDIFHVGHAKSLEQAKKAFKTVYAIAGVAGHEDSESFKGQTLMTEAERAENIKNCKWVDEVICPCPWTPTKQFLDDQQIDYHAHKPNEKQELREIQQLGKLFETQRTEGVSTSEVIKRIIKKREAFLEQLLKEGYSRDDLNLSLLSYLALKINKVFGKVFRCQKRKDNKRKLW